MQQILEHILMQEMTIWCSLQKRMYWNLNNNKLWVLRIRFTVHSTKKLDEIFIFFSSEIDKNRK